MGWYVLQLYAYLCVYVYVRMETRMYVCMQCTHARTHARMDVCMYVCTYAYMYVCLCFFVRVSLYLFVCAQRRNLNKRIGGGNGTLLRTGRRNFVTGTANFCQRDFSRSSSVVGLSFLPVAP